MPPACRPGPGPDHARGLSAPSQARAGPFGAPSSHPASRAAAAAAPAATLLKMGRRSRCARPPSRASLGDGSQACARADRPQPWSTRCSASPSTTAWAAPATVSGRSRDTQEPRRSQQLPRERHRAGHGRRAGLRWLRDAPEPNPQHAATGAAQDAHARPCTPPLTPSRPRATVALAVPVACPAWRRIREPSPRDARPGGRAQRDRLPIFSKAAAGAAAAAALDAGWLEGAPKGPARACARQDRPRARPARCNDEAAAKRLRRAAAKRPRRAAAKRLRGAAKEGRP